MYVTQWAEYIVTGNLYFWFARQISQWISTIYAGEKNPLPPLLITPLSAVALQSHVEGIGSSPGEGWGLAQTFLAAPSLIAVYL